MKLFINYYKKTTKLIFYIIIKKYFNFTINITFNIYKKQIVIIAYL